MLCTRLGSKRPLRKARFVLTEVRWLCHTYELPCVLQCLTPAIVPHSFFVLVGNKLRGREVDELFSDVGEYHGFIHTAGICLVSNRGGLGTSKFSEALWRRAGKGRRACNNVYGIWIPPPIPLWLPVDGALRFPPISAKWKRARTKINNNNNNNNGLISVHPWYGSSPDIRVK